MEIENEIFTMYTIFIFDDFVYYDEKVLTRNVFSSSMPR